MSSQVGKEDVLSYFSMFSNRHFKVLQLFFFYTYLIVS